MAKKFRALRADEIDCRVSQIKMGNDQKPYAVTLLLYKDARCDQNILDETVGPDFWQREHTRDNRNCKVSIWNPAIQQWVSKEDTGTESNTEREKGLASDSFKRACFNWGIGRELYTAPYIEIRTPDCTIKQGKNGKPACWDNFRVSEIVTDDGVITGIKIVNEKLHRVVFSWGKQQVKPVAEEVAHEEPDAAPNVTVTTSATVPQKPNPNPKDGETPGAFISRRISEMKAEIPGFNFMAARSELIKAEKVPDVPSATMNMDQARTLMDEVHAWYEGKKAS